MLLRLLILFFILVFINLPLCAQESTDSLWNVWENESEHDTVRLSALYNFTYSYLDTDPDSAFSLAQLMLEYSTIKGIRKYQAKSYSLFGRSYSLKENKIEAKNNWVQALKIYQNIGDKNGVSESFWNLGLIYYFMDQFTAALDYYSGNLDICLELKDTSCISGMKTNIGNIYESQGDLDKALEYYQKGAQIIEEAGGINDVALNLIGVIYVKQGKYSKALKYLKERLIQLENRKDGRWYDYVGRNCSVLNGIGDVYANQGDYKQALEYYLMSFDIANKESENYFLNEAERRIGVLYIQMKKSELAIEWCSKALMRSKENYIKSLDFQRSACDCLYKSYKLTGANDKALEYYELFNLLNDSLKLEETAKSLQNMEFSKQMLEDSMKQASEIQKLELSHLNEVLRKDKIRNSLFSLGGLLILLSIFLFSRYRVINRSKIEIQKEKKKSDDLLLNILPLEITEELKNTGISKPRHIDQISILFTDFVQFTETSSKITSEELVIEINRYFKKFDAICKEYKIEKIKTIGDSYMAVSTLGNFTTEGTVNLVLASIKMNKYVSGRLLEQKSNGGTAFEMRAGIHTGSVAAGIVGDTKFQYDIWGDAVNTASRMESNGEPGRINISQFTYEIIKHDPRFKFFERGKLNVKGKGKIEMYFVEENGED